MEIIPKKKISLMQCDFWPSVYISLPLRLYISVCGFAPIFISDNGIKSAQCQSVMRVNQLISQREDGAVATVPASLSLCVGVGKVPVSIEDFVQ